MTEAEAAAAVDQRLAKLAEETLPARDLPAAQLHLRRPFARDAVKWKVQSVWKSYKGGVVVGYIDARLVVERLNTVWPWWETRYENAGNNALRCHLTLFDPAERNELGQPLSLTRSDLGVGGGTDALKASNSDSLKRAAVMFGVGVPIYAMRAVTMRTGPAVAELDTYKRRIKVGSDFREVDYPTLTRDNELWLAEQYERWLEARGEKLFGPVLDHGDELGAAGLDGEVLAEVGEEPNERTEAEVAQDAAEVGTPLEDDRAKALVAEIEQAYLELRGVAPAKMPPRAFRAKLTRAAATSHDELEALLESVQTITASSR
jgi:hypothetical protein